jgi:uncharacterized damage-inducible protein DinB
MGYVPVPGKGKEELNVDIRSVLMDSFRSERKITRSVITGMQDGDMAFQPTPAQMSFGAQALHIASSYATLLDALQGKEWQWELGIDMEHYPTQEAILAKLDEGSRQVEAYLANLDPEALLQVIQTPWGAQETLLGLFLSWIAHEAHHRGQMVTYLRLKGYQPVTY